jgi:hypothetical protein
MEIGLIFLLLNGNVETDQASRYLQQLEAEKPYYAATMTDVLHSNAKYWKRRFKRSLRGELLQTEGCYHALQFAPKKDIKYLIDTAKDYGIDL